MAMKRYLGIGKETSFGTTASAADTYIDAQDASIDPAGGATIVYQGISGLDKTVAAGSYTSSGKFTVPVDNLSAGYLFKYVLGSTGYSVTGTTTYTHLFVPTQTPLMDSFTLFVGKDYFEHKFTGCIAKTITIDAKEGSFLTASVDVVGGQDSKGTLNNSPTYSTGKIYAPKDITMTIAGTDVSIKVEDFSLKVDNGSDNKNGVTIGSRFPRRAFRGALKVELDVTFSFLDTTELERFWGATGATTAGTTIAQFPIAINVGGTDLAISLPNAVYDTLSTPVSGRGRITQKAKITGLVASDGTGPVQFTLINTTPTY